MIQPKPFKLKCPKCSYSKIMRPKSDVVNPAELVSKCPKCDVWMKREELSGISKLIADIFNR